MIRFARWHASLWWISIHRRKHRFGCIPFPPRLKFASLDAFDDALGSIFAGWLECPVPEEKTAEAFTTMLAFETNSWHALVIPTGSKRSIKMSGRLRRPLGWS